MANRWGTGEGRRTVDYVDVNGELLMVAVIEKCSAMVSPLKKSVMDLL